MWIREGHGGTRNLSQSGSNKQGEDQKFRGIFRLKSEIQTFFPAESRRFPKKKRSSFQIWPTITKISVANTNLGLDMHSSSPEPVTFFGAQSLLGGAQFSFGGHKQSFGGAWPRNAPPPVAPGLNLSQLSRSYSLVKILAKWQHWSKRKNVNFEMQYI